MTTQNSATTYTPPACPHCGESNGFDFETSETFTVDSTGGFVSEQDITPQRQNVCCTDCRKPFALTNEQMEDLTEALQATFLDADE